MWIWLSEFARETFLHGLSFHNGLLKTLAPRSPHMLTHLLFCCLVAKSLAWLLESPWTPAPLLYPQNLSELAQTHANRVSDAIQPSHPLLPPSPFAFSLSQQQGLFLLESTQDMEGPTIQDFLCVSSGDTTVAVLSNVQAGQRQDEGKEIHSIPHPTPRSGQRPANWEWYQCPPKGLPNPPFSPNQGHSSYTWSLSAARGQRCKPF